MYNSMKGEITEMKKSAIINSLIEVFDENTMLKQKIALLTRTDKTGSQVTDDNLLRNRFVSMCYERGLADITNILNRRMLTGVEVNNDGTYWTYEQWLDKMLDGYNNPFDEYDTKFLLRDFSINELLKELEPWMHAQYERKLENRRLDDLKEKTKQKTE